ncbi:MAG: hypothetical protein R3E01_32385 [Pirellulaceae bacterium]|nr:hypothetical protein [Planctomycetales bacterium]
MPDQLTATFVDQPVFHLDYDPSGSRLFIGHFTEAYRPAGGHVVDATNLEKQFEIRNWRLGGKWAHDGTGLWTCVSDKPSIVLFDIERREPVKSLAGAVNASAVALPRTPSSLVGIGMDGIFREWDLDSGEIIHVVQYRSQGSSETMDYVAESISDNG